MDIIEKQRLIDKYKDDFNNFIQIRTELKDCLTKNCKSYVNKLIIKTKEYVKNVEKINNSYNSTTVANNFNKNMIDLANKFNQNKNVIEYNKYIFPAKPIPKNISSNYNKEFKKYTKNIQKLVKNHENNPKFKKKLQKIDNLKKKFINSKEVKNLKKCKINKCNDLHLKAIELTKNFSKKLCENEKKIFFCKLYKLSKKNKLKLEDFGKAFNSKLL